MQYYIVVRKKCNIISCIKMCCKGLMLTHLNFHYHEVLLTKLKEIIKHVDRINFLLLNLTNNFLAD